MAENSERDRILAGLRERIRGYATYKVGWDRSEDIAQETMVVLIEKYDKVENLTDLLRLAFTIARYKIFNMIRDNNKRKGVSINGENSIEPSDSPTESPEMTTVERQQRTHLMSALSELAPKCREIMKMKLLGFSFPKIAEAMKIRSINTLYVWDYRCRQKLRELLERRYGWRI